MIVKGRSRLGQLVGKKTTSVVALPEPRKEVCEHQEEERGSGWRGRDAGGGDREEVRSYRQRNNISCRTSRSLQTSLELPKSVTTMRQSTADSGEEASWDPRLAPGLLNKRESSRRYLPLPTPLSLSLSLSPPPLPPLPPLLSLLVLIVLAGRETQAKGHQSLIVL